MHQLPLGLKLAPAPSLDNFVIGDNQEVFNTVEQIANGKRPARILMLSGPPGSGKTHLLSCLELLPETARLSDNNNGFHLPASATLFTADDITDWSGPGQHQLFNLINLLRDKDDSIIVASSRERPSRMQLREDLRTRLASGLALGLRPLNDEDKATTLRQHAQARGLRADDSVIHWLLTHQDRDIRSLIAYLDALDQYGLQTRRRLTLALVREFDRIQRAEPQ